MVTYQFQPTHYFTAIGWYPPVLRIAPGDTVITTTVDAGGGDQHGNPITPGGNPQTGPFFVEGAEPGDMMAVHLDRLSPHVQPASHAPYSLVKCSILLPRALICKKPLPSGILIRRRE